MRNFFVPTLTLAMFFGGSNLAADRTEGRMDATRSVVHARHGMVAASHPLAVQIGVDVLKQGGSAVDAAIAVNAALGFLEPVANGVGGDLFAIVWDQKSGKLYGLNASGRSPLSLTMWSVFLLAPRAPWPSDSSTFCASLVSRVACVVHITGR